MKCVRGAVVLLLGGLVACDGPPLDAFGCACRIAGLCHASGAADPGDACHLCDPGFSPLSWAPAAGCVVTLVGDGVSGFRDGPVSEARISSPEEIALDAEGRLFIADSGNNRLRVVQQGVVSTLAGSGTAGTVDGPVAIASITSPKGIALDGTGGVYFTQSVAAPMVRAVQGGQVTTLAGDGTRGFVDGAALAARFDSPTSLAVDASGRVLVADQSNHRLRLVVSGQVSTFAGSGTAGSVDGSLAAARFNKPWGVAVGADGSILVADRENHRLRLISGGHVSTVAGSAEGFLDGPLGTALLRQPEAVTVDGGGGLVFSEVGNHAVRRVAGGLVTTLAGPGGSAGFADGLTGSARFSAPTGVAVDRAGRVYVGDTGNHRIRVIQP